MADPDHTLPKRISAPDEMHWGINYLREDIQDIRAEARDSRAEMKAEIGSLREAMEARYESLLKRMDSRFYWTIGLIATMMGMQAALTTALMKL